MKSYIASVCLICFILSSLFNFGQIGTKIPAERLPDGSSEAWQEAGCTFLNEPVAVSALFNVMDMGASGNGVDDDTEFVLQALELAEQQSGSGGFSIVYFPEGTYKITEELIIPSNTVIKGIGSEISILYIHHDDHAILFNNTLQSGLEDIKLTRQTEITLQKYFVRMMGADNCWIRGVETQMANSNHISLTECENLLISGCYIHECTDHGGGGNGYGVVLGNETQSSLIEDNIFRDARHSIVTGGLCHRNVIGYNASFDPHTSTSGGLGEWVTGDIELHGNSSNPGQQMGAYQNLFEGNYFNWIWIDAYWGDNGDYNTFFRNIARRGGLVVEEYYESTNGGNHYDCNDNQTFVNNYMENLDIVTKVRYGAPWGDGYVKSNNIGGTGHFAKNNKVYEILFPSLTTLISWKADGEEPSYLEDTSYYNAEKPDFIPQEHWPFDAFNTDTRNPAALRYESGGPMTVTVGFSSYILSSVQEIHIRDQINIFPNPCSGTVFLRLTNNDYRLTISDLYTISGKKIRELVHEVVPAGVHEIEIHVSELPAGIYFIKVQSENNYSIRKLIIQ